MDKLLILSLGIIIYVAIILLWRWWDLKYMWPHGLWRKKGDE